MPTAYLKKLAKLNNISVNTLEKFWSQAKEIAKSEGQGKSWGLITSIFQNKLKKEGYKIKALFIKADTDELDDADLGINVDPKEYHKQKSLQMSMQFKLDMIKKDLNKEADEYNKELEEIAKRLNEENRKRYSRDNDGDKWLHYNGTVTKEVLLEAYKDGIACGYEGFGTITNDDDIRDELNYFKNSVYPRFKKLINGSTLRVYRALDFYKLLYSDVDLLKNYFKYLKYNLMDRNSWTTSIEVAKRYIEYKWSSIILQMDCTLEDVNLPLSAWLEGYWFDNESKEINLKKSLKVKNIKCVFVGEDLKKLGFNEKEFNKVTAFKEETRTSESGQTFKFQRLSLSSIQKLLGYYLEDNECDSSTHWNDLYDDNDGIVYIEYNDNKTFYSVTNPLLKDLKTTNIRNCIIEYPSYTAYFGKDCRIEKFDSREDSPYVVKSYKGNDNMKSYLYKGEVITASSKQEAIHQIVAAGDSKYSKYADYGELLKLLKDNLKDFNCRKHYDGLTFVHEQSGVGLEIGTSISGFTREALIDIFVYDKGKRKRKELFTLVVTGYYGDVNKNKEGSKNYRKIMSTISKLKKLIKENKGNKDKYNDKAETEEYKNLISHIKRKKFKRIDRSDDEYGYNEYRYKCNRGEIVLRINIDKTINKNKTIESCDIELTTKDKRYSKEFKKDYIENIDKFLGMCENDEPLTKADALIKKYMENFDTSNVSKTNLEKYIYKFAVDGAFDIAKKLGKKLYKTGDGWTTNLKWGPAYTCHHNKIVSEYPDEPSTNYWFRKMISRFDKKGAEKLLEELVSFATR